ncbi:MAG: hypothetical protein JWO05_409 [Gemmatimonadetes bacterium]|nr:hypothetical protein [Gemmatimonadota bacterium]
MRRTATALLLTGLLAGCGMLKKTMGNLNGSYHKEPKVTAVWGDWVLHEPDSTAFIGAKRVDLALQPGAFTLTTNWRGRPSETVHGTATVSEETGAVTLISQTGSTSVAGLTAGSSMTLDASAAGNTLVFAPVGGNPHLPSSVWYRLDAAQAAGFLDDSTAIGPAVKIKPPSYNSDGTVEVNGPAVVQERWCTPRWWCPKPKVVPSKKRVPMDTTRARADSVKPPVSQR